MTWRAICGRPYHLDRAEQRQVVGPPRLPLRHRLVHVQAARGGHQPAPVAVVAVTHRVTAVPHVSATAPATCATAACAPAARVAVPLAAVIPRGRRGRAA